MKTIKIFFIMMFLFTIQVRPVDKVGSTSFQFLKIMMSARSSSLGEAFSSVANNSEAVYWNPAGLININGFDVSAGYVDWFMDAVHYSFAAAYKVENIGTFGIHGIFTDIGSIEVTRVSSLGFIGDNYNPGLTGEVISPTSFVIGLSYAGELTDKFSFGITAKYVNEDLIYDKAGMVVFDGGLLFKTGFKSLVVAASIMHFGGEVKYFEKSYPLPQTFNIGISGYLFSQGDHLIGDLKDHSLLLSYDMTQPRDFDQQHNIGVEYGFNDMFFLRGGYKLNHDQEGIGAGAGFLFKGYRIDYAYNDYGTYLNQVHKISIGFEID